MIPTPFKSAKVPMYEKAVAEGLRDPQSAQFRNVRVLTDEMGQDIFCGEVNGKNGYGAYVGYDLFYAPMIVDPEKSIALTSSFLASKVGLRYVVDHCPC